MVEIFPAAKFCHGKWNKLWADEPFGLYADFNLNLCFILQPQLLFILMELLKERLSHHILLSKINWMVCFHMTAYIFHSKLENKQIFV